MLQIKNLTITHNKDLRTILNNFSFVLNDGDKAVIIGEEGNGKSTLLKLIYEEGLVENYMEFTGQIIKNDVKIGYLSQEISVEDKQKSILEFCSEVPEFYEMTPKELSDIVFPLGVDLELLYSEQLVGQLSGGQKVKLQLIKIMMEKPNVLLLDEPSNDIDIDTLEWLEKFINASQIPVLFVSHDETLIENTANLVIHLEQIKRKTTPRHTIAKMPYRRYVEERLSKFTHQEQVARKERSEYEKQQEKFRQIQQKVEHQQNVITRQDPHSGQLLKKKMKAVKSMEKRFDREAQNMTEIPETEQNIFVKFSKDISVPNDKNILNLSIRELEIGETKLAENIELNIRGPEKICLIGKNGVGKTTLIRAIAKELSARQDIKVSYMPQNYEELLDLNLSPVEFLTNTGDREEITRIRTYLGSMKYTEDEMMHKIEELSGGQKAKLLLLKMSMEGSNVLILDEPTRNFSPLSNPVIREVLKEYNGAIISISHDRKYIREVCTTVYELNKDGLRKVEDL
ncbi:ABC-F family ATP-binding cassette domain-containing protein [Konateibacter massiliensis]|uniref:ABC-F family ATP-binding cassette domain-containing protein n=1 Tax=Konateibacter massiliensis TaxID=2002841 RepID=UPI000C157BCE|nr:ATP-binding cassette domain-containing protein [Konateibacter massiliensis]